MCGGFTGEYEEMKVHKKAEIVNVDGTGYIVHLLKDGDAFGKVDVRDKSIHYAQDVAENWENGILREDNEYIKKFEKSS
jgi:hypothetical protein|tara:strand:- start:120 stop:356 length:237 start_codon:yes stop_codon:yes gene_type:complete